MTKRLRRHDTTRVTFTSNPPPRPPPTITGKVTRGVRNYGNHLQNCYERVRHF